MSLHELYELTQEGEIEHSQEVRRADDDGHDEDDDDEPEAEAPATQRYCAMRVETGREDDGMEEEKDTEETKERRGRRKKRNQQHEEAVRLRC